jgi:hypothetical protein
MKNNFSFRETENIYEVSDSENNQYLNESFDDHQFK